MAKSTKSPKAGKSGRSSRVTPARGVSKPRPDFPLFPHQSGRWCKKVRGRFHYFGSTADDPKGVKALKLWTQQRDDIYAYGRPQEQQEGVLTVADLCNEYLESKEALVESGELSPRTFASYRAATDKIVGRFGRREVVTRLTPQDFEKLRQSLAKGRGPVSLRNDVRHIRMVFKYGYEMGLLERPVRFGPGFKLPKRDVLRRDRQQRQRKNGKRMFEPDELRSLIDAAAQPLRSMILLSANAGLGNTDVACLTFADLDLDAATLDFPRPKTAVERRAVLWDETVASIREWLEQRPRSATEADAELVFLTKYGQRWVRASDKGNPIDGVAGEFAKLLKRPRCPQCGKINRRTWDAEQRKYLDPKSCECGWSPSGESGWTSIHRPRLNFYALRHGVQTVGEGAKDLPALRMVMGHRDPGISDAYREVVSDDRLRHIAEYLRAWLFDGKGGDAGE